jgi:multiple sugar transport system substrate-binding protein
MLLGLTIGCGNNNATSVDISAKPGVSDKPAKAEKASDKPVDLLVYSLFPATANDFDQVFVNPVKQKYPNISLQLMTAGGKDGQTIEQVLASGTTPDILVGSILELDRYKKLQTMVDLNPLIKKQQFDLKRVEPALMDTVKVYGDKGEIYGIVYNANFNALFYNKDIFDKFGVPYPKDGMVWEDVVELGRKVTRSQDGVQYRGIDPENITRLASGLGVGFLDSKTLKATIQSWKPAYELLQKMIDIPGNSPEKVKEFDKNPFVKDHVVAMRATTNILGDLQKQSDSEMRWDLATYPQYKSHPGNFGVAGGRALSISPASKDPDSAFKVIATVLSDQVQTEMNKLGTLSSLTSKDVQKAFGQSIPALNGKNIAAIYKLKPGIRKVTNYDVLSNKVVFKHSLDLYKGGKDINTVIRETEEELNQAVAAELTK